MFLKCLFLMPGISHGVLVIKVDEAAERNRSGQTGSLFFQLFIIVLEGSVSSSSF